MGQNSKMEEISSSLSLITLMLNRLNSPNKKAETGKMGKQNKTKSKANKKAIIRLCVVYRRFILDSKSN